MSNADGESTFRGSAVNQVQMAVFVDCKHRDIIAFGVDSDQKSSIFRQNEPILGIQRVRSGASAKSRRKFPWAAAQSASGYLFHADQRAIRVSVKRHDRIALSKIG